MNDNNKSYFKKVITLPATYALLLRCLEGIQFSVNTTKLVHEL